MCFQEFHLFSQCPQREVNVYANVIGNTNYSLTMGVARDPSGWAHFQILLWPLVSETRAKGLLPGISTQPMEKWVVEPFILPWGLAQVLDWGQNIALFPESLLDRHMSLTPCNPLEKVTPASHNSYGWHIQHLLSSAPLLPRQSGFYFCICH
jgi:hypothetical protein